MQIQLPFGANSIDLNIDDSSFAVEPFWPLSPAALKDPKGDFMRACEKPTGCAPLSKLLAGKLNANASVVIVISDHTRPVPDHLLIPWIVEFLGVRDEQVSILVGTGTHRPSTEAELNHKLKEARGRNFRILQHDCHDKKNLVPLGTTACGGPVVVNRHYVEADIKIATGFIEPHFYAGFSGGTKAIVPGVAAFETVQHFHRADIIAHPGTTWGKLEGNPLQDLTRAMVAFCPPDFVVNVTLNRDKEITSIFCGEATATHDAGSAVALHESMVGVDRRYPVVITSNSGHPLDQNFYQTVKGICAATRIVEDGGDIVMVSACDQGLPLEGRFAEILRRPESNEGLMEWIMSQEKTIPDQWQVQSLLLCLKKAQVHIHSKLNRADALASRCRPVASLGECLRSLAEKHGRKVPLAILPMGPLTIPYVKSEI